MTLVQHGRGTNVPGDGDFDFMLRHNTSKEVLEELRSYVFSRTRGEIKTPKDGFRAKCVELPEGEVADIDVTEAKKNLELDYTSDECIKDRLQSIQSKSPEDLKYVKANIIMAKKILKKLGIYKKRGSDGATKYGGFGGIGVENWVLQNGGSFAKALQTYIDATKDENGQTLTYEQFIEKYPIFDFGNNHRESKANMHDRFSAFLGTELASNTENIGYKYSIEKFSELLKEIGPLEQSKETKPAIVQAYESEKLSQVMQHEKDEEIKMNPRKSTVAKFRHEKFTLLNQLIAKYQSRSKTKQENERENNSTPVIG